MLRWLLVHTACSGLLRAGARAWGRAGCGALTEQQVDLRGFLSAHSDPPGRGA